MNDGDISLHLSDLGRAGLMALPFLVSALVLLGFYLLAKGRPRIVCFIMAMVLLFLFIWLYPQLHSLYIMLFSDDPKLPKAMVPALSPLPAPMQLWHVMTMSGQAGSNQVGVLSKLPTILGWAMVILSYFISAKRVKPK